jgi:hypothetical protein
MKRRICAWPQTARYDGKSDPNNIENWRCGET